MRNRRAHGHARIVEFRGDLTGLRASDMPFVSEDDPNGDEIEDHQDGGRQTDPTDRRDMVGGEQPYPCDADEKQAESHRQGMTLVRTCAQRFRVNRVHHRQDHQVEHAAAEDIAQRDVREPMERSHRLR